MAPPAAVTAARGGYAVPSAADSAPTCSSDHAWPRGSPITAGQRQVRPSGSLQHSAAALGVVQAPAAHVVGEGAHPRADALGDPDACDEVADGGVQPFRPPRGRARRSWSVLRGRRRAAPRARRRAARPRPRPWSTGRCTHATPTALTTSTNLSGARWGGWPVWHNRSHTFSRRATFSRRQRRPGARHRNVPPSAPDRRTSYAQTASRICGGQAGTASRSASSRTRRAGSPGTARTSTVTGSGPWHSHANEACAASNGNLDSDRGRNQGRDSTPSAESVDVALADRTSATMLVDGQVGVLAARVLRGGGILAVLCRCHLRPGPHAESANPGGAILAAAQNADLLYLQHIVIPTSPGHPTSPLRPPAPPGREPDTPDTPQPSGVGNVDLLVFARPPGQPQHTRPSDDHPTNTGTSTGTPSRNRRPTRAGPAMTRFDGSAGGTGMAWMTRQHSRAVQRRRANVDLTGPLRRRGVRVFTGDARHLDYVRPPICSGRRRWWSPPRRMGPPPTATSPPTTPGCTSATISTGTCSTAAIWPSPPPRPACTAPATPSATAQERARHRSRRRPPIWSSMALWNGSALSHDRP